MDDSIIVITTKHQAVTAKQRRNNSNGRHHLSSSHEILGPLVRISDLYAIVVNSSWGKTHLLNLHTMAGIFIGVSKDLVFFFCLVLLELCVSCEVLGVKRFVMNFVNLLISKSA